MFVLCGIRNVVSLSVRVLCQQQVELESSEVGVESTSNHLEYDSLVLLVPYTYLKEKNRKPDIFAILLFGGGWGCSLMSINKTVEAEFWQLAKFARQIQNRNLVFQAQCWQTGRSEASLTVLFHQIEDP